MKSASKALTAILLSVTAGPAFSADEAESSRAADLLPPVPIMAAGEPIVADGRCAALTMGDVDNDGKIDLLVGQMSEGRLRIYRNIAAAARPEFGQATDFMAGDERACIPSGCYTAFNPQLVDFDGDGRTDILSPSFNSGIYFFRRTEDGRFAKAEMLEDCHGWPIEFRYNGAALACDWDADGDLDLLARGLVGARSGVNLIINEGRPQYPAYGVPQLLRVDGKTVTGKPCSLIDWDGDGKDDLFTSGGSASWYRNTGEKGKPEFQPAEILVPSGRYLQVTRRHGAPRKLPEQPGRIDSICVADVTGDGRLDLLATSTWCEIVESPELTDKQQAARKEIEAQASSLSRKYRELSKAPENESRQARIKRQREFLQTWKEHAALRAALREHQNRRDYSCVWLFERSVAGNSH
jgi:hypothetical protein